METRDDGVTDLTRGVYRRLYAGFIKGQRINKLSLQAEAWFWRVLTTVDDFGNAEADPELCRAATTGRRTSVTKAQIAKWLDEMAAVNLISFYSVKGEKYLNVLKFESWQPAGKNGRRIKRFPGPEEASGNPGESKIIQVSSGVVSASENTNDNENTNEDTSRSKAALVSHVFEFWKTEMNHPKAQLTPDRKRKIEERLTDSSVEEIETAIRGCKASDFHMGREPGHPEKFDDIELICRKRSKLETFIAKAPAPSAPRRVEPLHDKIARESCERCFGTGTETIPGKGGKPCDHKPTANSGSSALIESPSQDREARIS